MAGCVCRGRRCCLPCGRNPQCTLKSESTRKPPGKLSSSAVGGPWPYFREKSDKAKTSPLSVTPDGKAGENRTPGKSMWLLERERPGEEDGAAHNDVFP